MATTGMAPASIEIPTKDDPSEVIEIEFAQLPSADDMQQVLTAESAQLGIWVTLAVEYYRQGKESEFVAILDRSRAEANLDYDRSEEDQMRQLDSLAAYYVQQANREKKSERNKKRKSRERAQGGHSSSEESDSSVE